MTLPNAETKHNQPPPGGFFHGKIPITDLNALKTANAKRWADARPNRDFSTTAKRLIAPAAKVQYEAVEKVTGVPWYFIAIVHEREASQSWTGSLAQGDPWDKVSVHVPAGRGPFSSWQAAAVDALVHCNPKSATNKNWSIGALLTECEKYNGLGYAGRGVPSPYVWSGTDQYHSGKYVRDGVYDPGAVDKQLGCAGLLLEMMALDSSIAPGMRPIATVAPPAPSPSAAPGPALRPAAASPPAPSLTHPAQGSIGAAIAALLAAIFSRKR